MDINLALLVGGLLSSMGLGWAVGRFIKAVRQFFDQVG